MNRLGIVPGLYLPPAPPAGIVNCSNPRSGRGTHFPKTSHRTRLRCGRLYPSRLRSVTMLQHRICPERIAGLFADVGGEIGHGTDDEADTGAAAAFQDADAHALWLLRVGAGDRRRQQADGGSGEKEGATHRTKCTRTNTRQSRSFARLFA